MAILTGNNSTNSINGTSSSDLISGLGGDDKLDGKAGNDILLGGDGNDWLRGGLGADILYGGSGIDTAFYTHGVRDFSYNVLLGVLFVKDNVSSGNEGLDALYDVEYIQFNSASGFAQDATALYHLVIGNNAANTLNDTAEKDLMLGFSLNDVINMGRMDVAYGGAGADIFNLNLSTPSNLAASKLGYTFIDGQDGSDRLRLTINGSDAPAVLADIARFNALSSTAKQAEFTFNSIPLHIKGVEFIDAPTIINGAPTAVNLLNPLNSIAENTVVPAAGIKVADVQVVDDGYGTNVLSLSGADAALFELSNGQLLLKAGVNLDFETKTQYNVTVSAKDSVLPNAPVTKDFVLQVNNVNEAPTDILLSNASINENNAVGALIGNLQSIDPDSLASGFANAVFTLSGPDAAAFTIVGNELRAAQNFNFEAQSVYNVTVHANDGTAGFDKAFVINVNDVNEAPTNILLSNISVKENSIGLTIGTLTSVDPDGAASGFANAVFTLSGADAADFKIVGKQLVANHPFDFETKNSYNIIIHADDGTAGFDKAFTIKVTDVNEAPTALNLLNKVDALDENTPIPLTGYKVADIEVLDDALGVNKISLTGADAAFFRLDGTELLLKENVILDFETKSQYDVSVIVSDNTLGSSISKNYTLHVQDVNEAPTDILLSNASVNENIRGEVVVGTLSSVDPDNPASGFANAIFSIESSIGKGSYRIDGDQLIAVQSNEFGVNRFDFETNPTDTLTIHVNDGSPTGFDKILTINIIDQNDAPTNILLSNNLIDENNAVGALIGDLTSIDPDNPATGFANAVFSILPAADGGAFTIVGNQLFANQSFDFETKNTYLIGIHVDDGSAFGFTKAFTINIGDVNEVPPNQPPVISPTVPNDIVEMAPVNTPYSFQVQAFDTDGDTLTYSLVNGPDYLKINPLTGEVTLAGPVDYYPSLLDVDVNFTVRVSDGVDEVEHTYTLKVLNDPQIFDTQVDGTTIDTRALANISNLRILNAAGTRAADLDALLVATLVASKDYHISLDNGPVHMGNATLPIVPDVTPAQVVFSMDTNDDGVGFVDRTVVLGGTQAVAINTADSEQIFYFFNGSNSLTLDLNAAFNIVHGDAENETFVLQNLAHDNVIKAGAGVDNITIQLDAHDNVVNGDDGNDVFLIQGPGTMNNVVNGGAGADNFTISNGANQNIINGGAGVDSFILNTNSYNNTVNGDADNDVFTVNNSNFNTLNGGAGADNFLIISGAPNLGAGNTINGGVGNDTITFTSTLTRDTLILFDILQDGSDTLNGPLSVVARILFSGIDTPAGNGNLIQALIDATTVSSAGGATVFTFDQSPKAGFDSSLRMTDISYHGGDINNYGTLAVVGNNVLFDFF